MRQSDLTAAAKPILAATDEKKLLRKLAKQELPEDAEALLVKSAPSGDYRALLANLALRKKLGRTDGVIELMLQVAAVLDPAAIHAYLDSAEPDEDSWTCVLPDVERDDLTILSRSFQQNETYWNDASLSQRLEGALALARASQGLPIDGQVQARLLDVLVEGVLRFGDLPDNAFALGISPEEWGRRTAPIVFAKKPAVIKPQTVEALVQAPWSKAQKALALPPSDGPSYVKVLCHRNESPEEVLAFAEQVRPQFEEDADDLAYLLIALLRRIVPAGLLLPESWDEWATMAVAWFSRDRNSLAEAFADADRTISVERRHAMILDALESYAEDEMGHYAYPLLRYAWDDALFDRALSGLKDKPTLTASVYHNESESLGLVGRPAIPRLLQELEVARRKPKDGVASALWHSILIAAAVTADGELEDGVIGVLIDPGFGLGPRAQFYCWRYWQRLLGALPRARQDAIVKSWAAYDEESWEGCIPEELRTTLT